MASVFHIHCGDGHAHSVALFTGNVYMLADGTALDMETYPAWCSSCQRFVVAELVRTRTELEAEIRELEFFAERPGWIPENRILRIAQLPELRRRLAWRCQRSSPPHCLDCGSEQIVHFWPQSTMELPRFGRCELRFSGWVDATRSTCPVGAFSPEGVRLVAPSTDSKSRRFTK
jgi:hypothetical protein